MATSEDRLKILRMVQEGKISAEEGIQLLEALDVQGGPAGAVPSKGPRWLRVVVTDTNTGKMRVNVRLPLNVVGAGMKMGARFSPEVEGLSMEQLSAAIRSGETGKILDVYDDQDGEHVEVFVE